MARRLPWSTRDRAHLILARADVAAGRRESAKVHLDLVFPDADVYAASRLLWGDLDRMEERFLSAVHHWREAVHHGEVGAGLLRIGEVYAQVGRPADAVTYLSMIPADSEAWADSRLPLARSLLAVGDEGPAMSVLLSVADPAQRAARWMPELEFLRARAWEARCRPGRAEEIRVAARAALRPTYEELLYHLAIETPPGETWRSHFGEAAEGQLPRAWYTAFLRRPAVRPRAARLLRIDDELVQVALAGRDELVAALAARRGVVVHELGRLLRAALEQELDRLARWLEPAGRGVAGRAVVDSPTPAWPWPEQRGRRGPFRGEFWRAGPQRTCTDPAR